MRSTASPRSRPAVLAVAALLSAGAVVLGLRLLLADGNVVVHPNVFVNRGSIIDAHNTPSVARNPRDPDNLVIVNRVDRPAFSAGLHWSTDGGKVWRHTALPLPTGEDRPYGPDVSFGPDGTLYVSYVNLAGLANAPENLWLARSDDGGRTLSAPVKLAGELAFQARVAVDHEGAVHVTWLQASDIGLLSFVGPAQVVAARSTDGGKSFSSPVRVSDPQRERVGAATPVVDSEGRLVVLYQDFKDDARDWQNLPGPAWGRPFSLVVTRSPDGGRSFYRGIELESDVVPNERFLVFLPAFPSLAAGPDGSLYVAWSDGRNGDDDVFLRTSSDGGATWSEPARVNTNARGDGTDQYLPKVAAASNGRVDVLFYDRRRDPTRNVMTDAFLATSHDGGGSFDERQLSLRSFDARVGPSAAPHLPPDLGSRLGLVSWNDGAVAAWTDTRLGSVDSGRQDIVASRLQIPDMTARNRTLTLLVGLLLGAAVAFAAGRLLSRKQG